MFIVHRHADRAAGDGVVTVAKGVGNHLAGCPWRIQRPILTLHTAQYHATCNGNVVKQECLCATEHGKSVAPVLSVINKVAKPVLSAKPGQTE